MLTVGVLTLAVVAPILWTDQADAVDTGNILAGPSAEHWAGTDNLGRDIFYRVLVATRLSVELALLATAIAVVVGLVLGTAPFLLGRRAGRTVTASVNLAVAFPGLLLALFFAVIFGVGAKGAVLAIGLAGAPTFARLTQTLVASVAARDYVSVARTIGVGRFRILLRHVLPNIGEPLVVNATIGAGGALLAFAGLSFLGLGVQSPSYDWGRLLYDGIGAIYVNPAAALAPGIAVLVAGLAFNLFGESVAKGLGIGTIGGVLPLPAAPAATSAPTTAATDAPHDSSDLVLDVRDLEVTFPGPLGPDPPGARRDLLRQAGRGARHRGGVRVGQVADRAGGLASRRRPRPGGRHPTGAARHRPASPGLEGAEAPPRNLAGDGVPGPDDLVQPDTSHRRPAGGGVPPPPRARPQGGPGPCRRPVARGADHRRRAARAPVPPRVLRRDAPAGHDRHGSDGDARADRRRRAHHRPRRHRAGAGARPAPCDPRERRRRSRADQPRRHRGRGGLRPRARDVRRTDRRGPARRRAGHGVAASLHAGARGRRARHGHRPRPAAGRHPRPPRRSRGPARGLRVRRPLSPRLRTVPDRGPAARDRRRRAPRGLLARRRADPARVRGPARRRAHPLEVS